MSVEFTDEEDFNQIPPVIEKPSGLTGWLIETGIVKDQKQASYILFGLAILVVVLTLFVFFKSA